MVRAMTTDEKMRQTARLLAECMKKTAASRRRRAEMEEKRESERGDSVVQREGGPAAAGAVPRSPVSDAAQLLVFFLWFTCELICV